MAFCTKCGAEVAGGNRFCHRCGGEQVHPLSPPAVLVVAPPAKNPGVAVVLSFFVSGLGQLYNGEIGKGIGFLIAYSVAWILTLVLIGFVIVPIIWIFGMVDAYHSAERINGEPRQV